VVTILKSPSLYIQGAGELANIGQYVKKIGHNFFLLCSENSYKRIAATIEPSLEGADRTCRFFAFGGQCSKAEVARVERACAEAGCDVVIAAGGGKTIDTGKAVADNLGLPVVVVPTIASNDAPCTGLAVIYNEEGVVVKVQFPKRTPDVVLVDSAIIAKAPVRLFAAGIGDALATWFEARAAHASGAKSLARGKCSETALAMARLCYDILCENTAKAMVDVKKGEASPVVEKMLEATIYLSGVGSESGGLAAAHAINDGLAYLKEAKNLYHGEKVAFGVLAQLVLENSPRQEIEGAMGIMKVAGLPMTFEQLGVKAAPDPDALRKVAEAACVPTQFTKNLPFPVSPEDVYNALFEADRLGRAFS
jgi:glycerol dehydrogenase